MRAAETDDPEAGDATTEDGPADDRAAEGGALDAGAIAGARPRGPLGTVIRNRAVRRLEIAWTMGIAGDAAFTVAILVAAFELGGAVAVGILSVVRMAPSILAAPFAAIVAGRRRATELLFVTHAVRALGAAVVTVTIIGNLPPVVGLVAAAVAATVGSFVRPFQVAALPSFAAGPDELVAANSVTSTGEGVGSFTGPLIGGFLIATGGPAPAAAAATLLFAAAAASLARLQPSADERAAHAAAEQGRASSGPGVSVGRVGRELAFGVKVAARRPAARVILMGFATQVFVRGLMTTLIVVVAIELIGLGGPGVGTLTAAFGLGSLVGALASVRLASRRTLGPTFAVSLSLWGLPFAVIALVPIPAVAIGALFVSGIANAVLDVAGFTLLQRCVSGAERMSVFGLLEASAGFGVGVRGAVAPLLINGLGDRGALAVTGAILPIAAVAAWRRLRRVDRDVVLPDRELRLLRAIPLFERLPLTALERLAEGMRPREVAAGDVVMREGDPGDAYAIVDAGEFEVRQADRRIATIGPGDGFGEIALLRSGARTATVVARTAGSIYLIGSPLFLAAVAGPTSAAAARAVVDERLARTSATR